MILIILSILHCVDGPVVIVHYVRLLDYIKGKHSFWIGYINIKSCYFSCYTSSATENSWQYLPLNSQVYDNYKDNVDSDLVHHNTDPH